MRKDYNGAFTSLLVGAAFISAPAVNALELEEVIVTAQKRAESMQEVPIAISAFSGDKLERLGVTSPADLADITPGLNFGETGGRANPYIRGVGSQAISSGNEAPVATYYDGVYISGNANAVFFEFFDIERIEVLKGPQGTLFGRNATGGAINVITRTPSVETEAKVEATYGRYEDKQIKAYLSGPISDDAGVYGSVAVSHTESDGFTKNVNPLNGLSDKDVGFSESDAVRAKLLWEGSDELAVTLIADWSETENAAVMAWQPMNNDILTSEILVGGGLISAQEGFVSRTPHHYAGGDRPYLYSENWGVNLTVEYAAEFADIKYIGAYRESDTYTFLDGDGSNLDLFSFHSHPVTETLSQEIQFTSVNDGPLQWIAGLYYMDDDAYSGDGAYPGFNDGAAVVHVGLPLPVSPAEQAAILLAPPAHLPTAGAFSNSTAGRTAESWAIFGEGSYDLTDQTQLTLGLRYTEEDLTLYDRASDVIVPNDFANPTSFAVLPGFSFAGPDVGKKFDETTWSVVLDHQLEDDILIYASYKRGFKGGVYSTGTPTLSEPSDAEIIDAYELGVKSTLLEDSLRVNGAVFTYKYDNLQVARLVNNQPLTENAAEAEINGAEVDIEWLPTDNLSVLFNVSYLDGEYKSFPGAATLIPSATGGYANSSADLSGARMPRTPEFSANLGLGYYLPTDDLGAFSFDMNVFYTDEVILNNITEYKIDAYETVNASATWDSPSDQFYVSLWGKNLTDEIVPACNAALPFGYMCTYNAGVTYGITGGVRFGN